MAFTPFDRNKACDYQSFTKDTTDTGLLRIESASGEIREVRLRAGVPFPGNPKDELRFVECFLDKNHVVFLTKEAFVKRIDKEATFDDDWKQVRVDQGLHCDGWDSQAKTMRAGWPHNGSGLIPPAGAYDRLTEQRRIWQELLERSSSSGEIFGRTWQPSHPIVPPLTVYLVRADGSFTDAQFDDAVRQAYGKRGPNNKFQSWVEYQILSISDSRLKQGLVRISSNLFGFYYTYMSVGHLSQLIKEQTGITKWLRDYPTEDQARKLQKSMLEALDRRHSEQAKEFAEKLKNIKVWVVSDLSAANTKAKDSRKDAAWVMGNYSANQWGNEIWSLDVKKARTAEWLHRSAQSFGPLPGPHDYQSPDNLVFGTYEANSDMTRAERTIREVFKFEPGPPQSPTKGSLTTRVVNKGNYELVANDGTVVIAAIPSWIQKLNYPWLAPELLYKGNITVKQTKLHWNTKYHMFSQYSPLTLEEALDTQLLRQQLKTTLTTEEIKYSRNPVVRPTHMGGRPPLVEELLPVPVFAFDFVRRTLLKSHLSEGKEPSGKDGHTLLLDTSSIPWSVHEDHTGWVVLGQIELFGLSHYIVDLEEWKGEFPTGVEIDGEEDPVYQRVQLGDICVSDFIPLLEDTPFKGFKFANVNFLYQNYHFDQTRPVGWSLESDIAIGMEFGVLHTILTDVLQVSTDSLALRILSSLGTNQNWNELPLVSQFSVQGILHLREGFSTKLCEGVTLSEIGVEIFGVRSVVYGLYGDTSMEYGFRIFGELDITVPGSVKPLTFDYDLSEFGGVIQMLATVQGDIWQDALGTGLDLSSVSFSTSFGVTSSQIQALDFSVQALLKAGEASAVFTGTYSTGGHYRFSATLEDFGINGLLDLFLYCKGKALVLPEHVDVHVGSASISIETNSGLSISVDRVEFDKYSTANATITLSTDYLLVHGDLEDVEFPHFGVLLIDAFLQISFQTIGTSKATEVSLGGTVELQGWEWLPSITAAVHFYKLARQTSLDWTIYGSFKSLGNSSTLGTLFEPFNRTFLSDLTLDALSIIIASRDDPAFDAMNPQNYPIHQGVQVCAMLGNFVSLDQLLRRKEAGLMLNVGLSPSKGASFDVVFPTETVIDLGKGVTTDPIVLSLDMYPVQVKIAAGITVPVPNEGDLHFEAFLSWQAGLDVTLTGQMHGLWKNPFGISHEVAIGPDIILSLTLYLPEFLVSGIPKTFAFVGGFAVGEVNVSGAVQISEDPTKELLRGHVDHLNICDVVEFADSVTGLPIPAPPDFLDFREVDFYMCMVDLTIGSTKYRAGFSFRADMLVFGASIYVDAFITAADIQVKGNITSIQIGPLALKGHEGKNVSLDLQLGVWDQELYVDGAILFQGSELAILLKLVLLPSPTFQFDFELHFDHYLTFVVQARTIGMVDLRHISKLEFSLHADLEESILEHIHGLLVQALEEFKKKTLGPSSSNPSLGSSKKELQDEVDQKYEEFEAAKQVWENFSKAVHAAADKLIDDCYKGLNDLEDLVDRERRAYNKELNDAEKAVRDANADRATALGDAKAAVTRAKNEWNSAVDRCTRELDNAKNTLNREFGNARQALEDARREVNSVQWLIDATNGLIRSYEDASWLHFWKKALLPGLYASVVLLKGSLWTANQVFSVAQGVIETYRFITVELAVTTAESALAEAGRTGREAFEDAEAVLERIDNDTDVVLKAVQAALKKMREVGDAALRDAERKLREYKNTEKEVRKKAQDMIDNLINSAEYKAFQAAGKALALALEKIDDLDVLLKIIAKLGSDIELLGIEIAEWVLRLVINSLVIRKITLKGKLSDFLGSGRGPFLATVVGTVLKYPLPIPPDLELDMKKIGDFIENIAARIILFVHNLPPEALEEAAKVMS